MFAIEKDVDLTSFNSFRLASKAQFFAAVSSEDELLEALEFAKKQAIDVVVLGGGTNVVFTGDVPGLTVHMSNKGVSFDGCDVTVAAGEQWHELVDHTLDKGFYGLENLSLIPGTVGAAPMQNIGAYGVELHQYFSNLQAMNRVTLESRTFGLDECEFGYRDSFFRRQAGAEWVITRVSLRLREDDSPDLAYPGIREALDDKKLAPGAVNVARVVSMLRRQKLPDQRSVGNVGSFFKNPIVDKTTAARLKQEFPSIPLFAFGDNVKVSAAWMIDQAGLKGRSCGDIEVARQHALVLINTGAGTSTDVMTLVDEINAAVSERYGMTLEIEPRFYPASPFRD